MIATQPKRMSAADFTAIFTRLKAAGLSPHEIADDLGVNRVTLYQWASGKIGVSRRTEKSIRSYVEKKLR